MKRQNPCSLAAYVQKRKANHNITSVETGIMWGTKLGAGACDGVGLSEQGFECQKEPLREILSERS